MAGTGNLEGRRNIIAKKLLWRVAQVLDKCQMEYWLEGGTLLGVVRENRLLPWDNDLDVSVKDQSRENVDKLIKALKKSGLRVRVRVYKKEYSFANTEDYRLLRIRNKYFWFIKGSVVLDVFFKHHVGEEVQWVVDRILKSVPSGFYQEITKIKFNNYLYSIPARYDDYLTYRYGNWRVPKKDWDTFKDDKAIIG